MRVCFDGLCFANRRTAVIDEATQTPSPPPPLPPLADQRAASSSLDRDNNAVVNVHDTGGRTADQSNSIYAQSPPTNQSKNTVPDSLEFASKEETGNSHRKNHATTSATPESKVSSAPLCILFC